MGKVFTPQEVRYGHIPERTSFTHLSNDIRTWLPRQFWFKGGMVLGSVLTGNHTFRSDLDLFVVHKARASVAAEALRTFLARKHLHIPVNINLWSVQELQNGRHSIGAGFLTHLRFAAQHGGLITQYDPTHDIAPATRHRASEDLAGYIAGKARKLREFTCTPLQYWGRAECNMLQNIAMAPLHATRRWLHLHHQVPCGALATDDVVRILSHHHTDLALTLKMLVEVDRAYTRVLMDQGAHGYNARAYKNALDTLARHTGDAAAFLSRLGEVS